MERILTDNVWKQIASLARACKRRSAALAYVSTDNYVSFKKGDILVCDASDAAIKSGETSAAILARYYKKGVQLYSRTSLHAKVLVMGSKAILGSSNLSQSSAHSLREATLLTSRPTVVSQAKAFVHMVKNEAEQIDRTFIERVLKFRVKRAKPIPALHRRKRKSLGSRFWIVRVHEIESDRYQNEQKYIDQATEKLRAMTGDEEMEPDWIRWTGKVRFRKDARAGDTIVQLWSTPKGNQVTVYPPTPILFRQDRQNWTRFYCDTESELSELSWAEFQKKLRKLGITYVKKNTVRELNKQDAAVVETIWEK